tara:strand:- start:8422 stop:10782 length:2361 start_codon:yes stop_codon:yes gene_type:complete
VAKVTPIQTNFTGGEITPKMHGRVDLQKYGASCKTLKNFICFPHGGIVKRSGTRFVAECKDSANTKRLIPFVFSTTQAYILEFGNDYIRFYRNEGQILDSGSAYEISSPWGEEYLDGLSFTQSADILYVTHPEFKPRKVTRTGHTTWTVAEFDQTDGPYLDQNTSATTMTPSHASGSSRTITASVSTFASTDVGRLIRLKHSSTWGYAKVTGFTSATVVTVTILSDFGGTGSTTDWRLGAWSDTTGWPTCVTFYQDRLFFANTTNQPNTVYSSKSGDFENFAPTATDGAVTDDSALVFTLATSQVNAIRWMQGARQLQLGTSDGPFLMSSGSDNLALTPTNVTVNRETSDGVAAQIPVTAGRATLFTDRNKLRIRELAYKYDIDGFVTPDLSLIGEHITSGSTIKSISYARSPNNLVWALLEDGGLRCMTYEREQDVVAWHRHIPGGIFGSCTVTVTDYANIANNSKLVLTKSDGTTTTFNSATSSTTGKFHSTTSNNQTATNLKTLVDADSDFTATVASNVVTIKETSRAGASPLTITTGDSTRLAITSQAEAKVLSIAVIPTATETEDQLYMIVERTINGATKHYVEFLEEIFDTNEGKSVSNAFFVDSGLTYTGTSANSVSGLTHLEGETVQVLVDGAVHPNRTVSSGAVSLASSGTEISVGLAYQGKLVTLDPEVQTETGASQGKVRRIERATVRVVDTYNLKIAAETLPLEELDFRDTGGLEAVPFREGAQSMDTVTLFTGDKRVLISHTPDRKFNLVVQHDQPQPCTVLAIMYALVVSDR